MAVSITLGLSYSFIQGRTNCGFKTSNVQWMKLSVRMPQVTFKSIMSGYPNEFKRLINKNGGIPLIYMFKKVSRIC